MTSESGDIARLPAFEREVSRLHEKLRALRVAAQSATGVLGLDEALEELGTALEELHIAQEQLHQQNEALAEAQLQLEGERRRYRDLFDFAAEGLLVTDADGTIEEANRAAAELLGVRQSRLAGKPLSVFVADAQRSAFFGLLARLQRTERILGWELELQPRAAELLPVELSVAVMRRSGSGDVADRILRWSLRDVRERRRAAEQLHERESRLRAILDTAVDAIVTIDERGVIESVNAAVERMFGYASGELIGRNVKILMPPPYREEHDGYIARYLETGEARIIGIGREVSGRRSDGSTFPVDLAVSEVKHGGRRRFTGILRDVSERRRLEDELARHRAELAHAGRVAAVGELTSSILHELRQPLTAISTYAQACLRLQAKGDDARLQDALSEIVRQCGRAGGVTERLRRFGRRETPRREPRDLNVLVRAVLRLLRHDLDLHRVELRLELAESLPPVAVDRLEIEQVLVNLLRNAIDAVAEQSPELRTVTVRTEAAGEGVEVSVSDTGPGLPAEQPERIMEAFYTTKPKGTGLGLSISRGIVEAHGGRLQAEPGPQRGARFRFTLPTAP